MKKKTADRFPWDGPSDRTLQAADRLDPADRSTSARYVREVAQSVLEHRAGRTDPRRDHR